MSTPSTQHSNFLTSLFWIIIKTLLWLLLGIAMTQVLWITRLCTLGETHQLILLNQLSLNELHILNVAVMRNGFASHFIGMTLAAVEHANTFGLEMAKEVGSTNLDIQQQPFVSSDTFAAFPSANALLQISVNALALTVLRLLNLLTQVPVFVWVGLVGLTDGLVQRELRRLQGGRESALLYHRAKSAISPAVLAGMLMYLALPLTTSPDLLLAPFALLFGIAIRVSAGAFKKYL